MGRPAIFLKDWCLKEGALKVAFLEEESKNPRGLIIKTGQEYQANFTHYPHYPSNGPWQIGKLQNGIQIQIPPVFYEKLRGKFNTYKKKKKDAGKVQKNYYLEKQTVNFLSKLKEINHWDREEIVIEYLANVYQGRELQFKSFKKIENSSIHLQNLKNELDHYKGLCVNAENDKITLRKRINELEDLLARAYLSNKLLKETLQDNQIEFPRPLIDEETVERYKSEIRNNLNTHL